MKKSDIFPAVRELRRRLGSLAFLYPTGHYRRSRGNNIDSGKMAKLKGLWGRGIYEPV